MAEDRDVYEVLAEVQHRVTCPKEKLNKFGGYRYRSLEDINAALKPVCQELRCGYVFVDSVEPIAAGGETRWYLKAEATFFAAGCRDAIHVSAYAREPLSKKGMDDAQVTGLASSYARKYAACALFAIDSGEEIDSMDNREASGTPAKGKAQKARKNDSAASDGDLSGAVSIATLDRMTNLVSEYASLCGRSVEEVLDALKKTGTLKKLGYTGENVTEEQGRAACGVVANWVTATKATTANKTTKKGSGE